MFRGIVRGYEGAGMGSGLGMIIVEVGEAEPDPYNRGLMVRMDRGFDQDNEHNEVWATLRPVGEPYAYAVNARLRCPMAAGADPQAYGAGATEYTWIQIVQQRPYQNALWTVYRCPYCGALWRLAEDEARIVIDAIYKAYERGTERDRAFWYEVASTIAAGYRRDLASEPVALKD